MSPKLVWYPIDTLCNILSYIGMSKAPFAGAAGSKTEPLKFCHLFFIFFRAFFSVSCHKTLITSCLWSLVVTLERGSILQAWRKLRVAKNLALVVKNMSKKRGGSKCARCLHRVLSGNYEKRICEVDLGEWTGHSQCQSRSGTVNASHGPSK